MKDISIMTPGDHFRKGVEDARMQQKVKQFLNTEFNKQANSIFWAEMGLVEVGE
jgi:hypothetical protein|tara:strand:- start:2737 stop:2898 length:162 start_codon:yes stop_codon:yes gene_type:complete